MSAKPAKILITGNMGYVGPVLVRHLRKQYPDAIIIGLDAAFFGTCLTNSAVLPESRVNVQHFGDVRDAGAELFQGVDSVIHLAAISNDPMGKKFEDVTMAVNFESTIEIAKMAKKAGVRNFVFASSCSVYGASSSDAANTESSALNPLTAYARSKMESEKHLAHLASDDFTITCIRFATACGMSPRLRLDLVLNDFVASAVTTGKITLLSDGMSWRPLIHVEDMARALEWAAFRNCTNGGTFLAVNGGSNEWNYLILDLAKAVVNVIPGASIDIRSDAPHDSRSYRVDFSLFKSLAPNHQPQMTLERTISDIFASFQAMDFGDVDFRNSSLIRLKMLERLQKNGIIDEQLRWKR